jgi:hypothetical protein
LAVRGAEYLGYKYPEFYALTPNPSPKFGRGEKKYI